MYVCASHNIRLLFSLVLSFLCIRIPPGTSGRRRVGTQVPTSVSWVCMPVFHSWLSMYVGISFLLVPLVSGINVVLFCVVPHLCLVFDFQPPDLGGVELARKCRPACPGSVYRSSIPVCIHISVPHPTPPLPCPLLHLVISTQCTCVRPPIFSCISLWSSHFFGFEFHPACPGGVELARKCRPAHPGCVCRCSIPGFLCIWASSGPFI
jgi:hypothetical protein